MDGDTPNIGEHPPIWKIQDGLLRIIIQTRTHIYATSVRLLEEPKNNICLSSAIKAKCPAVKEKTYSTSRICEKRELRMLLLPQNLKS